MAFTYESSESGAKMHVGRCEPGGVPHLHLVAVDEHESRVVPVCVPQSDVRGLTNEMLAWAEVPSRWTALQEWLADCIDADEAVRLGMVADGETELAAPFGGLVSANRSTLRKMRELES